MVHSPHCLAEPHLFAFCLLSHLLLLRSRTEFEEGNLNTHVCLFVYDKVSHVDWVLCGLKMKNVLLDQGQNDGLGSGIDITDMFLGRDEDEIWDYKQ